MQIEISYIRSKKRIPIKSLKIAPPSPYFSKYLSKRKNFLVGSIIKLDSNHPNFKPDQKTSFFGVVSLEKLCPIYCYYEGCNSTLRTQDQKCSITELLDTLLDRFVLLFFFLTPSEARFSELSEYIESVVFHELL